MDAHLNFAITRFERELSDLCYDMLAASSPDQVRQQVLGQMARWFSLDQAIWVMEPRTLELPTPGTMAFLGLHTPVSPALFEPMMTFRHHNPLLQTMIAKGDSGPIRPQDVQSRSAWRKNPFCHEVCTQMGLREMMAVEINEGDVSRSSILAAVIGRDKRGFTQAESRWMNRIRWAVRPVMTHLRRLSERTQWAVLTRPPDALTAREKEVFHWMGYGKRNKEIATILNCSPRTVEKHVEAILRKTHSENRASAVQSRPTR